METGKSKKEEKWERSLEIANEKRKTKKDKKKKAEGWK